MNILQIKAWDNKAEQIEREFLEILHLENSKKPINKTYQTILKKNSLLKNLDEKLKNTLQSIQNAGNISSVLSHEEEALLHWTKNFWTKAQRFYTQHHESWTNLLWGKIIQLKASGGKTPFKQLIEEHFSSDAILTEQQRLVGIEKKLKDRLVFLEEKKKQLFIRYDLLCLSKANREAQGSLSIKLGSHLSEAFSHPVFQYLERDFQFKAQGIKQQYRKAIQKEAEKWQKLAFGKHNKIPKHMLDNTLELRRRHYTDPQNEMSMQMLQKFDYEGLEHFSDDSIPSLPEISKKKPSLFF